MCHNRAHPFLPAARRLFSRSREGGKAKSAARTGARTSTRPAHPTAPAGSRTVSARRGGAEHRPRRPRRHVSPGAAPPAAGPQPDPRAGRPSARRRVKVPPSHAASRPARSLLRLPPLRAAELPSPVRAAPLPGPPGNPAPAALRRPVT